jgi:hypothetical protein
VSASADQPGAIESWWTNGVRKCNAGYDRSVYKPFPGPSQFLHLADGIPHCMITS